MWSKKSEKLTRVFQKKHKCHNCFPTEGLWLSSLTEQFQKLFPGKGKYLDLDFMPGSATKIIAARWQNVWRNRWLFWQQLTLSDESRLYLTTTDFIWRQLILSNSSWHYLTLSDNSRVYLTTVDSIWQQVTLSGNNRLYLTTADFIWQQRILSDNSRLYIQGVGLSCYKRPDSRSTVRALF